MKFPIPESLRKYVDVNEIEVEDHWQSSFVEERGIIVALSSQLDSLFEERLYHEISGDFASFSPFQLVFLAPFPVLTAPVENASYKKLMKMIEWVRKRGFRLVATVGVAKKGILGSSGYSCVGLLGSPFTSVIKAITALPLEASWVELSVAEVLEVNIVERQSLAETTYVRI